MLLCAGRRFQRIVGRSLVKNADGSWRMSSRPKHRISVSDQWKQTKLKLCDPAGLVSVSGVQKPSVVLEPCPLSQFVSFAGITNDSFLKHTWCSSTPYFAKPPTSLPWSLCRSLVWIFLLDVNQADDEVIRSYGRVARLPRHFPELRSLRSMTEACSQLLNVVYG